MSASKGRPGLWPVALPTEGVDRNSDDDTEYKVPR